MTEYFTIGDVHGKASMLDELLQHWDGRSQLVFLGDLIDRGEDSRAVLERVKDAEQVTFVGEVGVFVEQIQEHLPQANYQETLPSAANLALWAWDKEADSLHDFVPNYLKRVEAEENWLKNHTESGESYIKRL